MKKRTNASAPLSLFSLAAAGISTVALVDGEGAVVDGLGAALVADADALAVGTGVSCESQPPRTATTPTSAVASPTEITAAGSLRGVSGIPVVPRPMSPFPAAPSSAPHAKPTILLPIIRN